MRSRPRLERTTAADVVGDDEANVEALGGGFDGGTGGTGATLLGSALPALAYQQTGYDRSCDITEYRSKFVGLHGRGVGNKDDVLILDREFLSRQVRFAVPQVKTINDRRNRARRSAAYRLIERTYDGVGLVTEKKDALRLGQIIA
jgi:hypothetical protein